MSPAARSGARRSTLLRQALGYAAAGVLNSGVGWAVVLGLEASGRVPSALANAVGFAAGLAVAFLLHRRVFDARRAGRGGTRRYATAVAVAFALSQATLALALAVLPQAWEGRRLLAQALALAVYSPALFVFCRYWVFARPPTPTPVTPRLDGAAPPA